MMCVSPPSKNDRLKDAGEDRPDPIPDPNLVPLAGVSKLVSQLVPEIHTRCRQHHCPKSQVVNLHHELDELLGVPVVIEVGHDH